MSGNCDIEIRFDDLSKGYYVIWQPPVATGWGSNRVKALQDLQRAARFGVDSLIAQKLKKLTEED